MYSAQLLDHFERPRHAGAVANPDAAAQLENPVCGDVLQLSLRIESGRIAEIRFLARGCVPALACASALTELAQGRTVEQARALRLAEVAVAVGGLPPASEHAAQLALDTLAAALGRLNKKV